MAGDLPDYYFRIRENGATVFRVDTENRQRRIDMEPIATVNVKNGKVKPQGDRVLSPGDLAAIEDWLAERRALLAGAAGRRHPAHGRSPEPDDALGADAGDATPSWTR